MFDANGVETLQESFNHLADWRQEAAWLCMVCVLLFVFFFFSCLSWSRDQFNLLIA